MMNDLPFIKDRKIRVGLVGLGRVAKNHVKAILSYPDDLELVAICDVNEKVAIPECEKIGAKYYPLIEELAAADDVDVVVLCTPSGLHPQQTILLAEAGKHVITEKPMASQFHLGLDMIKACDEARVRLFVVKQNRYNETLQILKRTVEKGRFGRIYFAELNVFWHRPQAYYDLARWRGTRELDGGALMNQASHYLDLLYWLLGPVETVHAMTATLARQIESEDTATLNVRWRSGALGSVNVTNLVHDIDYEGSITIIGEKGRVKIGGIALNKLETWAFVDEDKEDDQAIKDASYDTDSVYGFGHNPYYQNVIDVFRGKTEPMTDGREGIKSLEILIAAYMSARDRCEVGLPLVF